MKLGTSVRAVNWAFVPSMLCYDAVRIHPRHCGVSAMATKKAARRAKAAPQRKAATRDLTAKSAAAKQVTGGYVMGKGPVPS